MTVSTTSAVLSLTKTPIFMLAHNLRRTLIMKHRERNENTLFSTELHQKRTTRSDE